MIEGLHRILAPLKRKIFLIIGRAIVTAIENSGTTQRITLNLLAGETLSDVERFQEYGFETYPFSDSQALTVFLDGNRAHGIVLCIHDRRYKPDYLAEGEVVFYTDEDKGGKHRVHFKRGRMIEVDCTALSLACAIGEGRRLADERLISTYNGHTHPHGDPAGTTGAPNSGTLSLGGQFTSKTEAL